MTEAMRKHVALYIKLGFSIMPLHRPIQSAAGFNCSCSNPNCSSPGKHPFGRLVPHGLRDASSSPDTARNWFGDQQVNIGIVTGATSGIFAIDIDPRHDGDESLATLEAKFGPLPATWRFLTGGGGEHIVFHHPGNVIPNSANKLGAGIDIRGDGGYIVAPPSLHLSGRPYAISVDHHPDETPLAEAPSWLLERLIRRQTSRRSPGNEHPNQTLGPDWRRLADISVPEGQRNQTIASVAGHLLRHRVDPFVALTLVKAWNIAQCIPPLPDDEVDRTVRSIASREFERRRRHHGR